MRLLLFKSHIKTYTRKDGVVVTAHDDSRVSKKQNVTWYHGSPHEHIDKFDLSRFGSGGFENLSNGAKRFLPAVYLTDSHDHAAGYGEHVHEVELSSKNLLKFNAKKVLSDWAKEQGYKNAQDLIDKYHDGDAYEALNADHEFDRLARQAKGEGKDAAIADFGDLKTVVNGKKVPIGKVAIVLNSDNAKVISGETVAKSVVLLVLPGRHNPKN